MLPNGFRLRLVFLPILLLGLVLSVGCGGRRSVYPVRGKVLFEDKPTPGALVIFHPLKDPDPEAPRPIARVGTDGSFTPTTYTTDDGAPAGEYAVTVTWVIERDMQDVPKDEQREPKNLVPDRYGKAETSGLHVIIKSGTNELQPFRLTRK